MKILVCLTGNKGSGKTTTLGIFQELFKETREITFAARLKDACAKVFNIPRDHLDDPRFKEKDLQEPAYFDTAKTQALIEYFNVPYDHEKHVKPHVGKILHTPRQIAQYVGTEVLRNVDSEIHCKGAFIDLPENGLFCITDCRFPNEYDFCKAKEQEGFKFYPLYISNRVAEAAASKDTHVSEKYIPEIARKSRLIDNNGSMSDLRKQIVAFITEITEELG